MWCCLHCFEAAFSFHFATCFFSFRRVAVILFIRRGFVSRFDVFFLVFWLCGFVPRCPFGCGLFPRSLFVRCFVLPSYCLLGRVSFRCSVCFLKESECAVTHMRR